MNNNETTINELDNTDQEIIKQLNQDGRKSFRQIAKELNRFLESLTKEENIPKTYTQLILNTINN